MRFFICWMAIFQIGGCANNSNVQDSPDLMVYEASSRGYFYRIEVDQESIRVFEDRSLESYRQRKVQPIEWQELLRQLGDLHPDTLAELEVETEQSATDRSAIGVFSMQKGTRSYETPAFDDNNPPESLKALIALMRALAETVE